MKKGGGIAIARCVAVRVCLYCCVSLCVASGGVVGRRHLFSPFNASLSLTQLRISTSKHRS